MPDPAPSQQRNLKAGMTCAERLVEANSCEALHVLAGRLGQKTPHGMGHADAGQFMNGHGVDMPMEVFSAGATDLDQLVMFVVDATRPFSSPAKFE
jgi:hypothetical protein